MAEVVAKTYASSLYETAQTDGCEEEILEELENLDMAFEQERDFLTLLSAPELDTLEKMNMIHRIFHGRIHIYTENFLKVLTDKRRIKCFHAIYEAYREIYNSAHNRMEFTVVTVIPVSEQLLERLKEKLSQTLGAEILLKTQVDSSILGGIVLRSQGEQVDASVKKHLEEIRMRISSVIA